MLAGTSVYIKRYPNIFRFIILSLYPIHYPMYPYHPSCRREHTLTIDADMMRAVLSPWWSPGVATSSASSGSLQYPRLSSPATACRRDQGVRLILSKSFLHRAHRILEASLSLGCPTPAKSPQSIQNSGKASYSHAAEALTGMLALASPTLHTVPCLCLAPAAQVSL